MKLRLPRLDLGPRLIVLKFKYKPGFRIKSGKTTLSYTCRLEFSREYVWYQNR